MKFISICSGIEAASVAFGPLGWKAIAFSEIEPFPCAVLAHHYPDVPNFGDMTKFRDWPEHIFAEADAIVGGPPCQAFSVAGLRNGLKDDRGNLTLTYAELIDHADAIRLRYGKPPVIVLYENVPGLLSDKTGAFGCFLGAIAGEDGEIKPPGGKWTNSGCVSGPQRALAWAVTDAQFFGVAQRRRRVFVVASAREGFDPAAVLFEPESMRRDTAPSREAGEGAAGGAANCSGVGGVQQDGVGGGGGAGGVITLAHGQDGAEVGFDRGPTLTCNHEAPIAAYAIQAGALRTNPNSGPDGVGVQEGLTYTLEARAEVQAVCVTGSITHTLKAEGFDASEDGTGRGQPIVAFPANLSGTQCASTENLSPSLGAKNPTAVAFAENSRAEVRLEGGDGQRTGAISTGGGKPGQGVPMVATPMAVRRLVPEECEALQGFPRGYSKIPWRKKPAEDCPDGPRYKALGNSWAVPNVRWIGRRIDVHLRALSGSISKPLVREEA